MKTWMMVKSGIKKNRSSSITLVILITFAALCLNIGINVVSHMGTFVDEKNQSLNGADYLMIAKESCINDAETIIKNTEDFESLEKLPAVYYESASIQDKRVDEKAKKIGIIYMNMDQEHSISKMKVIDAKGDITSDSIVLPYSTKTAGGYQAGDEVVIKSNDQEQTYRIYGFSEDVMFSTTMNIGIYKCFVPAKTFELVYDNATKSERQNIIGVRLKEGADSDLFDQRVTEAYSEAGSAELLQAIGINYTSMKYGTSATINIIMSILVVFALLIVFIAMIVIHFSVSSYIERDIKNLGSMEAIGFTCKMIRQALVMQFFAITVTGFVLGTILSYALSNVISSFVAVSIGLQWKQTVTPEIILITLFVLVVLIVGTTYKVSGRIKKVTPIMALRNGSENYHFGKNHMPLDVSHGNLHWLLGMKGLLQNKKQNRSIGIILMIMSFSIVFVSGMFYSFVVNTNGLINLIGIEKAQLEVVDGQEEHEEFFREIAKVEGVEKTLRYKGMNLSIENEEWSSSTMAYICNDFQQTETSILAEGRFPEHDNEISMSYRMLEMLHTKLGDVVSLKYGDVTQEFVVVGIVQHISYLGCSVQITEDGVRRCNPKYDADSLLVYGEENVKAEELEARVQDLVYERGGSITNRDERLATMLLSFSQGMSLTCITICLITAFVSVLILYYIVIMRISKEKLNYGIQKAVGFTTRQLILHTIISFVPVAAVSSLAGGMIAAMVSNKILTRILNTMTNLKDAGIIVPISIVAGCTISVVVLTTVTTGLAALRIRKIEVRGLVEV